MRLIILLLISINVLAQEHIIINNSRANNLRGRHGVYSELNPIALPDTFQILPKLCLTDNDLESVTPLLSGAINTVIDLPTSGTIFKDSLYKYQSELVICRQTHTRTIYTPKETPALFSFYRANSDTLTWIPNEQVLLGWKRIYNSNVYTVLQSHMTLETYRPDLTLGVLWSVEVSTPYWTIGVAYKVNDLVIYQVNGFTYKCLQAHTSISTWNPIAAASLWQKQ